MDTDSDEEDQLLLQLLQQKQAVHCNGKEIETPRTGLIGSTRTIAKETSTHSSHQVVREETPDIPSPATETVYKANGNDVSHTGPTTLPKHTSPPYTLQAHVESAYLKDPVNQAMELIQSNTTTNTTSKTFDASQVDRYELIGENSHLRSRISEINKHYQQQVANLIAGQNRELSEKTNELDRLKSQLQEVQLDRQMLQNDLRTLQVQSKSRSRSKRHAGSTAGSSLAGPPQPNTVSDRLKDGFTADHVGSVPLSPRKRHRPPPRLNFEDSRSLTATSPKRERIRRQEAENSTTEKIILVADTRGPGLEAGTKDAGTQDAGTEDEMDHELEDHIDLVILCNDHFIEKWDGTHISTLGLLAQCPLLDSMGSDAPINIEREVRKSATPQELAQICVKYANLCHAKQLFQSVPPLLAILATLVQLDETCLQLPDGLTTDDRTHTNLVTDLVLFFEQVWVQMLVRLDVGHQRAKANRVASEYQYSSDSLNLGVWSQEEYGAIFVDTKLAWLHMILLYLLDVFELIAAWDPESLYNTSLPKILMGSNFCERVPPSILCRCCAIVLALLENETSPLSYTEVLNFVEPLLLIRTGGTRTMDVYKSIYCTFNGYAAYESSGVCKVQHQSNSHDIAEEQPEQEQQPRKNLVVTYADLFEKCIDFVKCGSCTVMTRIDLKIDPPDKAYEFGLCCVQQMYETMTAQKVVHILLHMMVMGGVNVPMDIEPVLSSTLYTLMSRLDEEVQELMCEPVDFEQRVQLVGDILRFLETLWVLDENGAYSTQRRPQMLVPQPEHIIVLARIALSGPSESEDHDEHILEQAVQEEQTHEQTNQRKEGEGKHLKGIDKDKIEQQKLTAKRSCRPVFPEEVTERARYIIEQCTTISESNEIYLMMMAVDD